MRTLDQIRAEYAWMQVNVVDVNLREKYRNLAKSLPALVMSNGLMQSLAFLEGKGKGKGEHGRLLEDIRLWLIRSDVGILPGGTKNFQEAMTALSEMPSVMYQRATEESLAILRWIRHLVDTLPGANRNETN